MEFSTLWFWHDLLTPTLHHNSLLIMLSHMHQPKHSLEKMQLRITVYDIYLAALPNSPPSTSLWKMSCLHVAWSLDNFKACFAERPWETFVRGQKCLSTDKTSKEVCSCCLHPQGGSRGFVGGGGSRATPLCKQLTLVVMEGRGQVWSPCSPGTVPSDRNAIRSLAGTRAEPSDSICRFLQSRDEGNGESQRQVGPPPTSWYGNQHLPTAEATFLSAHHHPSDNSKPLLSPLIIITISCSSTFHTSFQWCNRLTQQN